jgi:hypothetical protein
MNLRRRLPLDQYRCPRRLPSGRPRRLVPPPRSRSRRSQVQTRRRLPSDRQRCRQRLSRQRPRRHPPSERRCRQSSRCRKQQDRQLRSQQRRGRSVQVQRLPHRSPPCQRNLRASRCLCRSFHGPSHRGQRRYRPPHSRGQPRPLSNSHKCRCQRRWSVEILGRLRCPRCWPPRLRFPLFSRHHHRRCQRSPWNRSRHSLRRRGRTPSLCLRPL